MVGLVRSDVGDEVGHLGVLRHPPCRQHTASANARDSGEKGRTVGDGNLGCCEKIRVASIVSRGRQRVRASTGEDFTFGVLPFGDVALLEILEASRVCNHGGAQVQVKSLLGSVERRTGVDRLLFEQTLRDEEEVRYTRKSRRTLKRVRLTTNLCATLGESRYVKKKRL